MRWALRLFFITIAISAAFSLISSKALDGVGIAVAFCVLLGFIAVGILFDIVGIAVASADERPFHSMAARKVPGAFEALKLLRGAEKVSSFCNDVVGDIAGIISGTTSAVIVTRLVSAFNFQTLVTQLLVSGVVAGLTVGGKAVGKGIAMGFSTEIVHLVGRVMAAVPRVRRKRR
ncbi:hypothetical protein LJC32_06890 [Oscillospiraceae bacterium OttesenSCG-928-F05]|nr:hypothetical protein [Oscillospiraceae bacterium OttesenSCG-928-F05]